MKKWQVLLFSVLPFRESGQVHFGQVAVVPKGEVDLDEMARGYEEIRSMHCRINDFPINSVREMPPW